MPNKLSHIPIEGTEVRLRLLESADIELIRLWRNADNIRKWFKNNGIIETEQQRAWYENYKTLDNDYLYIVEWRQSELRPIGQVGIYNINWEKHTAEFGRLLVGDKSASGKGLIYEASCLILEFWKNTFGIVNYFLEVKTDNARAIRLYEMLGFQNTSEKNGYLTMCLRY